MYAIAFDMDIESLRQNYGDPYNNAYLEIRRVLERHGWRLERVSGSHHIYRHPEARPLSLQPQQREAKPYQISQFLDMVEEHGLKMERRR